jgi:ferritin-like metal-binding protein YciE
MTKPSVASTKLIQYLNDAYGTEMRMETALQAHIAMTAQPRYRKRLKEHLTETRRHGREVKQRIKKLGGTPATISTPGPDLIGDTAQALLGGARKAVALAQAPLHAILGPGEDEQQLGNAKTEYVGESEEIVTYAAIETLADTLGDSDTRQLARTIRRDEERMRSFLEKEIPRLTKAMAKAEIPSAERRGASNGRTSTGKPSRRRPEARAGASVAKSSTKATKKATKAKRPARPAAAKRSTKSGKAASGRTAKASPTR